MQAILTFLAISGLNRGIDVNTGGLPWEKNI
jgi:hypothetical protein